ncbi:hypothetical protein F7725_016847, partial [Dissostichus mawsoni]
MKRLFIYYSNQNIVKKTESCLFLPERVTQGPKLQHFLNLLLLYYIYSIIQDPALYGLWTEVTFHLGCPKCRAHVPIPNLKEALANTHTNTHTHTHERCFTRPELWFSMAVKFHNRQLQHIQYLQ